MKNERTTNNQTMTDIKFGTDGWRGLIADDFTFENVRRVAGAIASYVLKHEDPAHGIIIGYDTRFASDRAGRAVADVVAAAGIPVRLANDYIPTPAVSYNVKKLGAAGGVMVTSSHNPWNWNGVKFKAKFGGSATPAIMKVIEDELAIGAMPSGRAAQVEEIDLKPAYVEGVCQFADLAVIRKAKFKFAIDSMYGSGRGVLPGIFDKNGIQYVAIRQEVNPLFPGINPEPIIPHVELLQETVVKEKCHAGLATDGDADRIGAVAEDGSFVDSHKCFAVLLNWLLVRKKWPGDVVRAFNTTGMLDRIAARHGRTLHEVSIGFKYAADLMMEREILIARGRIRRHRIWAFFAGARRHLKCVAFGERDGRRGKATGAVSGGSATRIWRALLRAAGSAHLRRNEEWRCAAGGRSGDDADWPVHGAAQTESRWREVLSRCAEKWRRRRPLGIVPSLRNRASAAGLRGGCDSRASRRNSGRF